MSANVGVGLLGYGPAGEFFHAPLLVAEPRFALRAISTSNAERATRAAALAKVVASPDALLEDPSIDLVVIATPSDSHFPLAAAALRAGKHVVIDKPFVARASQADELIALAARERRVLTAFQNRRWDGDFRTVRSVIASGRLGRIVRYEAWWDRYRPAIRDNWRDRPGEAAGLAYDLGSHLVDQLLQLFGVPQSIDADLAMLRAGSPVCDHFEIRCIYDGMRASVGAATLAVHARPRFAVHGERASFVKYGVDPQEAQLRAGLGPNDARFGIEPAELAGEIVDADGTRDVVPTERGDYPSFYAGVAATIVDGTPVPVDPRDARRGLALLELAERSSTDGRRIELSGTL